MKPTPMVCVMTVVFAGMGCGRSAAPVESESSPPVQVTNSLSVSADEALAFAEQLEMLAVQGDPARVDALFDWHQMVLLAASGLTTDSHLIDEFEQGLIQSVGVEGIGAAICGACTDGGGYALVRLTEKDDTHSLLFRLRSTVGLTYHDLVLHQNEQGQVLVKDFFNFGTGELMSQSLRRHLLLAVCRKDPKIRGDLDEQSRLLVEHDQIIQAMRQELSTGNHAQALKLYAKLPEALQKEKSILLSRLVAAKFVGRDQYVEAVNALRRAHPEDIGASLHALGVCLDEKDHWEALRHLGLVEEAVGGDPHLTGLKASIVLEQGNLEKAEQLAKSALERDPYLQEVYWTLVEISLIRKDFAGTVDILSQLVDRFMIDVEQTAAEHEELLRSPEYRQWAARETDTTR